MKNFRLLLFFSIVLFSCSEDQDGLSLDSSADGLAGSLASFITLGDRLYVIDDQNLNIFDISILSDLTLVNSIELGDGIETIYPYKNLLFFGTNNGMLIYNIDDKDNPIYLSRYDHVQSCDPVVVKDDFAYLTLRRQNSDLSSTPCFRGATELQIIDISDLSNPKIVNSYQMGNPIGLGIHNDKLYVCDTDRSLHQFSINETPQITFDTIYNGLKGHDMIIKEDLMLLVSKTKLNQFEINDSSIHELGTINY